MGCRLMVAYSLILMMTLLAASLLVYRIYHSHERSYRRRLLREQRAYEAREVPPGP